MGITRQVSRLPLTAFSLGLEAWERSAGLRKFAVRRGGEALQIAAHTPLGRLLPKLVLDDGAEEEAARITAAVRADEAAGTTTLARPEPDAEPELQLEAESEPEPDPAPRVSEAARQVGAPGAVTAEVDKIADQLHIDEPDSRADLPIPDFDNISLGSLRARLRSLSLTDLVTLREWEQAHAHRLPVLTALDNRIAKLGATEAEAYPRDTGSPTATPPRSA